MTREEEAIEYLETIAEYYSQDYSDPYVEFESLTKDELDALHMAIKALEQTRWVPVSEKLPKEHKWMGTQRFGTTISDEVYVTFETPDGQRFTKHICFWNGGLSPAEQQKINAFYKGAKPIAWMPLPEPYRAEIGG